MRISDWSSDVCSSDLGSLVVSPVLAKRPHGDKVRFLFNQLGNPFGAFLGSCDCLRGRGRIDCKANRDQLFRAGVLLRKDRSEEHTSELQSLMRISYAVFCLKKKNNTQNNLRTPHYITNNKNNHTNHHTTNAH